MTTGLSSLDRAVIGRTTSFFAEDVARADAELRDIIRGRRILVIGGAGSIGSHTLRTVIGYEPALVHVIDHNENGLAELVRGLRSAEGLPKLPELLTLPFDYGGAPFQLWMAANPVCYDHVLNFAALKHVRSEKDPYSILAMLETNVVHLDGLSSLLASQPNIRRVFSVSTDKAANPSSMMGATKRLMEHALFLPSQAWSSDTTLTSARFANVAFSNGSLLQGWQFRLAAGQPLACPGDTRRFFVTQDESGQLCTLVAFLGSHRTLSVPALDPAEHLVRLEDVAERFLAHHGYTAYRTDDPDEAVARVEEWRAAGRWPLLITPLDTAGEKPYEEFVGRDEAVRPSRFSTLREIDYQAPATPGSYDALVAKVRGLLAGCDEGEVSVDGLRALIAEVEPAFAASHRASERTLDERI